MSIIQELYAIFDNEYARHIARRSSKNRLLIEINRNLAYLRAALAEELEPPSILAGLEDQQYRQISEQGVSLNSLCKRSLQPATCGGIREFEKYHDWTTEQLINNAYERISTLQKLNLNAASVDIRSRLQYLFKYLMLVTAHIEGRALVLHRGPPR